MTGYKDDSQKREYVKFADTGIWGSILEAYRDVSEVYLEFHGTKKRFFNSRRFMTCSLEAFNKEKYIESAVYFMLGRKIEPTKAFAYVARVGEYGADKYGLDNWKGLTKERLQNAFLRHFYMKGINREDFNLPHWSHCLWNLEKLQWIKENRECRAENE